MFETGVMRSFNARHFLRGDFEEESVPHTHPYRVEWVCTSEILDENGFATDIAFMEDALESVLGDIDDVLLNELDFFHNRQPSLENVAVFLLEKLRGLAQEQAKKSISTAMRIKIWESETAWASFSA